jgi:hypothetical protein
VNGNRINVVDAVGDRGTVSELAQCFDEGLAFGERMSLIDDVSSACQTLVEQVLTHHEIRECCRQQRVAGRSD